MKFMNNHYSQSQIFGRARCKMPMNLQFFAESPGDGGDGGDAQGIQKGIEIQNRSPALENGPAAIAAGPQRVEKPRRRRKRYSNRGGTDGATGAGKSHKRSEQGGS